MKRLLVALLAILVLRLALPAQVAKAWVCELYTFSVDGAGVVSVTNASDRDEAAQAVTITLAPNEYHLTAPALLAHTSPVTFGTIPLPAPPYGGFVQGDDDCGNGFGSATVDPPPPGENLICVQIDNGGLTGILTIRLSNVDGEDLGEVHGRAYLNSRGDVTIFVDSHEQQAGYFLISDGSGLTYLYQVDANMVSDCATPDSWATCIRVLPEPVLLDHECNCEVKR